MSAGLRRAPRFCRHWDDPSPRSDAEASISPTPTVPSAPRTRPFVLRGCSPSAQSPETRPSCTPSPALASRSRLPPCSPLLPAHLRAVLQVRRRIHNQILSSIQPAFHPNTLRRDRPRFYGPLDGSAVVEDEHDVIPYG